MSLPGDLTTCVLSGTYVDSAGFPQQGTVSLTPSAILADPTGSVVIPMATRTYQIGPGGTFQTDPLAATDCGTITPSGWQYNVVVTLAGQQPQAFGILLPHSATPVDISGITPTVAQPAVTSYLATAGGTLTGTLTLDGSPPLRVPGGATSGDVLTSDADGNATWQASTGGSGGTPSGAASGDLGGSYPNPQVTATHLASPLPVNQGGTGAMTAGGALTSLGAASATALTAETTRAETAETANTSAITAETSRAETAEALALAKSANLSDLASASSARTNLGLGSAATQATSAFDAAGAAASETTRAEAAEALLAPLASPALTGTPTAPTKTALTDSTALATTAYTDSAVGVETARAGAAEALKAPLASPALTGTPSAPTASALTASTQIATTAYADSAVSVEKSRAQTAESANASAVTAETSRAETAEALLAPKASPALTGTPTAPTASALTDSTQVATTAYADSAVAVETSRAEAAEALKAPLASPALTGTPTAPTASALTDSTQIATTAYADSSVAAETSRAETAEGLALAKASNLSDVTTRQTALNNLTGTQTSGRYLRSDGTNASLAAIQAADVPTLNQSTSGTAAGLSATLAAGSGGTGQTTQQAAMDALAGAQTSGDYLRGNGTHVVMAAIAAADLPAGTISTQGALQLDGTAGDIAANGTQAAGSSGLAADAKHVHPSLTPFSAADAGWQVWNGDIATSPASNVMTNFTGGVVFLARLIVRAQLTISKIAVWWVQPTGGSPANSYLALFNSTGSQVGSTTSDLTSTASGIISPSITSQTIAAGNYYVACLIGTQGSSTGGPLYFGSGPITGFAGGSAFETINQTTSTYRWAKQLSGQSAMPGSLTYSSNTTSVIPFWCALA